MDPSPWPLGRTKIALPPVGLGGVPRGEVHERISEEQAQDTLAAAWSAGIRYCDTSPWYGRGLSELRFGTMLRSRPRGDYVLSTKSARFRPGAR